MRKITKLILAQLFLSCGLLGCVLAVPTVVQAQTAAALSLNTNPASQVSPGQRITAQGKLTINGRPVAHAPVVLFLRPTGGPDVAVANAFTNGNGDYTLVGICPARPGRTLQVSVVSGGSGPNTARAAKILTVR